MVINIFGLKDNQMFHKSILFIIFQRFEYSYNHYEETIFKSKFYFY